MKSILLSIVLFLLTQLVSSDLNACCFYWNSTNTYGFRIENEYFVTSSNLPVGAYLTNYYPYQDIKFEDSESAQYYSNFYQKLSNPQKELVTDKFFLRAYTDRTMPNSFYCITPNSDYVESIRTDINFSINHISVHKENNQLLIKLEDITGYKNEDFKIELVALSKEGLSTNINYVEEAIAHIYEDDYYFFDNYVTEYNVEAQVPIDKYTSQIELRVRNAEGKLLYTRPLMQHEQNIKVYPTQIEQNFTLESTVKEGAVCLYTLNGSPLPPIPFYDFNSVLNIQNLNRGIYIMRIMSNNQVIHTQKIVKL